MKSFCYFPTKHCWKQINCLVVCLNKHAKSVTHSSALVALYSPLFSQYCKQFVVEFSAEISVFRSTKPWKWCKKFPYLSYCSCLHCVNPRLAQKLLYQFCSSFLKTWTLYLNRPHQKVVLEHLKNHLVKKSLFFSKVSLKIVFWAF